MQLQIHAMNSQNMRQCYLSNQRKGCHATIYSSADRLREVATALSHNGVCLHVPNYTTGGPSSQMSVTLHTVRKLRNSPNSWICLGTAEYAKEYR